MAERNFGLLAALTKIRLRPDSVLPGLLDGFLVITGFDLTPFCNPRNAILDATLTC